MTGLHDERVVWVTGAASGIGRATVTELVAEGAQVVASDLPAADFSWVDGDAIAVITGDVTDPDHNDASVTLALERFGRIDGAVLNAGVAGQVDLFEGPLDHFDRTWEVNVRAIVLGIRAAAGHMRPGAALTTTASTSGLRGDPGMWTYNTSKAAVLNLGRNLAVDLNREGIAVGIYHPGWVITDMGGQVADITIDQSVAGLVTRFDALDLVHTGAFEAWDGRPLPY